HSPGLGGLVGRPAAPPPHTAGPAITRTTMMAARRFTGDLSISAVDGCAAVVSYIPPDLATRAGGGLRASPDVATMPCSLHQGDHGMVPLPTSLQKAFNTTLRSEEH